MSGYKSIFIITILVLCNCSFGQQFAEEKIVRANNIKSTTKCTYFGDKKRPSMTYTEWYDKSGKAINRIWIDNNDSDRLTVRQFFFYTKEKQLIRENRTRYIRNDSVQDTLYYDYDRNGKLIEPESDRKVTDIKMDEYGNILESIERSGNSVLRTVNIYNKQKLLIKELNYFNRILTATVELTYNNNRLAQKIFSNYDESGTAITDQSSLIYSYDKSGLVCKLTSKTHISKDSISELTTYTYEYVFNKEKR